MEFNCLNTVTIPKVMRILFSMHLPSSQITAIVGKLRVRSKYLQANVTTSSRAIEGFAAVKYLFTFCVSIVTANDAAKDTETLC